MTLSLCLFAGTAQAALQDYPEWPPTNQNRIVEGLTPKGTTFNVFDYWIVGQLAQELASSETDFTNLGINAGHALLFTKGLGSAGSAHGALYGN